MWTNSTGIQYSVSKGSVCRTMKVVELLISVAMVHCRGTPSSRVAASVCTVALMAPGSCCFRYRYALQTSTGYSALDPLTN